MSGMPRNNRYSYLGNGVLRIFKDGDLDRYIIGSIWEIEVQQITSKLLKDLETMHAEGILLPRSEAEGAPYNSRPFACPLTAPTGSVLLVK
jgi:hypothetical protein